MAALVTFTILAAYKWNDAAEVGGTLGVLPPSPS
jgi:hypothetical protein